MNLGNQKKNKQMKFYHLFLYLIQITHLDITNIVKNSVEVLKRNNVPGFESIKLINSKQQPPNLKKLLIKVEFSNEKVGIRKCQDLQVIVTIQRIYI